MVQIGQNFHIPVTECFESMNLKTSTLITALLFSPLMMHATPINNLRSASPGTRQGAAEPETKTILDVEKDRAAYLDKPVTIQGTLEISAKYHAPFDRSQGTHYAFSLSDLSGGQTRVAYVYVKRGESADKLQSLIHSNGGKITGNFTIRIPKDEYDHSSTDLVAELVDYRKSTSGTVVVQVVIDERGNVISAQALSGPKLLRKAAVDAAYSAKFQPTKLSGQPVKVTGTINYKFEIESDKNTVCSPCDTPKPLRLD